VLALRHSSLKAACLVPLALLGSAVSFQTQETQHPLPLENESHYRLIFENAYVRVFRVALPGNDATLAHRHDLPYVYVALGPADFVDAVADKPEKHVLMTAEQVFYRQGGFAHVVRNDVGSPLDGVIIEFLIPQGEPQNTCGDVVAGPPALHCSGKSFDRKQASGNLPLFETDQTHVSLEWFGPSSEQVGPTYRLGTLVVVLSGTGIHRVVNGRPEETLPAGSTTWLLAESSYTFNNPSGKPWSYLSLSFEGTQPLHPAWKPK
jgi:hypothetical protein